MDTTSGTRANITGKILEDFVHAQLAMYSYMEVPSARFNAAKILVRPIYSHQHHIGTNIYEKQRRVDFIVHHPTRLPNDLVIQCKWQASSGSVEEKYPFELMNIALDNIDAIILLDGGGYSHGAKKWLLSMAGKDHTLKAVLDQGQFSRWAKKNL